MHIGRVEKVAHLAPALVEDLFPLGGAVELNFERREVDLGVGLKVDLRGREVDERVIAAGADEHFLGVGGNLEAVEISQLGFFFGFEVVERDGGAGRATAAETLASASAALRAAGSATIIDFFSDHGDRTVIGRSDGETDDSSGEPVGVDLDGDGGGFLRGGDGFLRGFRRVGFFRRGFGGFLFLIFGDGDLVALWGEGRGSVLGEGDEVDAALSAALEDKDWQVRQNAEDLINPRS